ncbi:MAG: leucine-rich repeat domain-containing protein, partial [Candidatus Methanomethylophilaceae archaeon]|nr:leucine-rich repeat domain-containing protein [Candidatus Methanomethylophilaceae archaeon]
QGCTALTNVRLSPSITALPRQCFTYCSALQTIAIPASVTEIGPFAFYECSALTNANLARGVQVIYPSAFSYCTSLTQVTIPSSVTEIMGNIFNGCSALQTISVNSANTHYRAISAQTGDGMDALKDRVLKELREVFRRKAIEADLEEPERWPGRSRRAPRWRSTSPASWR